MMNTRWGLGVILACLWGGAALADASASVPGPQDKQSIAFLSVSDGYWQVWVMDADGQAVRQVSRSAYDKARVSWLPDGRSLLVCGNQGQLARLDIASGIERPIEPPLQGIQDAVVSPDGQRIAFSLSTADSIDDNNIWMMNIDGSDPLKLTQMPALQHGPTWAADGKALYFLSGPGGQAHDIWRLTLAGRRTEQLTVGQLYHFDVALSGQSALAFSSNRSGNYEIWHWPQGGNPVALTQHPALDAAPSFSSDGRSIAFESSRGGSLNIWRLALAGGEPHQLSFREAGARAPAWQPARVRP